MLIHISKDRFNKIRGEGYRLTLPANAPAPKVDDSDETLTHYHLLDGERSLCKRCGVEFNSVKVDTRVTLETLKYVMRSALNVSH